MVDCRCRAAKVQDAPGTFCIDREQGGTQKYMAECQNDIRAKLKELLMTRAGTVLATK